MREDLAHRTAGEDILRERLAGAFGADVLAASELQVVDDDGPVVARVGRVRVGLGYDDRLYCTIVHAGVEHLGVVEADGRVRWVARVSISSPAMN